MGLLALIGGDEFKPGNEEQDQLLVECRGPGPAYVVPTAAARQRPEVAVHTAQKWFNALGIEMRELTVLKRSDANATANAELAERGGMFYLSGGDPGRVVDVLHDSPVWQAMLSAWQRGAALAGSSAGAMAFGEWTLVRQAFPDHTHRRYKPALGLIPLVAVAPDFETFGHRWVDSALARPPRADALIVGIDERSAVVWDGRGWIARGPGKVTLVTRCQRQVFISGMSLPLPEPGAAVAQP